MFSKLAIIGSLATLAAAGPPDVSEFDWDTIEPSSSLNFTTCYEDHNCAKLLVPLDWLDTENPARASLALITRPAAVKRTDPSFGGTIIVNPGGPGGSGVDFLLGYGEPIQKTASGPNNTYEILSFDPRGVHLSTPTADCYREEFLRGSWKLEDRALGYPTSSHSSIRMKMARSDGFGRRCAADDETADIRQFISTASVARDMVEIVDQLAQLHRDTDAGRQHNRESQDDADRQHDAAPGRDTNPVHDTDHLELRSDRDATPRIMYWGISYGTVLGRYFASMFPGRIGRMLLEGVEDVVDYTTCDWALNLPDTEAALAHFWETCFDGGSRCALYKNSDTSPDDIRGRVEAFMDDLDENPAAYITEHDATIITKQDILHLLFRPLYFPQVRFPGLATTLASAMAGNFTGVYENTDKPAMAKSCGQQTDDYTWQDEAQASILCGDGPSLNETTAAEFAEYVARLTEDSPHFGPLWSRVRIQCSGWKLRPKYRFTGPWTTPDPDASLVEGKPAAPILFVSSTIDPVTPLSNARRAMGGHPGSALLAQESVGHGALFVPSRCREEAIAKYFATGEVPSEPETLCQADCRPFQPDCDGLESVVVETLEASGRRQRNNFGPLAIYW